MDVRVCVAVAVVEVVEWSREEGWWGIGVGIFETVVAAFNGETTIRRVDGRGVYGGYGSISCWFELIGGSVVASWMSLFMAVDC